MWIFLSVWMVTVWILNILFDFLWGHSSFVIMDQENVGQEIDHIFEFSVLNGHDHILDVIEFFSKDHSFMGVQQVLIESPNSDTPRRG